MSLGEALTLGEALPREMARVRDMIPIYLSCGAGGVPATMMMRASLDAAARALAEGDVVAMLRAYTDLQGWKL